MICGRCSARLSAGSLDFYNSAEEVVLAPHSGSTGDEIVRRGQALYDREIRAQLEPSHRGEFLVLDIDTGDYEIGLDEVAALKRAKARNPHAALYMLRVGEPTAYRVGGLRVATRA